MSGVACHIPLGGTGPVPRLLLGAASCFQLLAQTCDCIIAIAGSTRRRSSLVPLRESRSVGRLHSRKKALLYSALIHELFSCLQLFTPLRDKGLLGMRQAWHRNRASEQCEAPLFRPVAPVTPAYAVVERESTRIVWRLPGWFECAVIGDCADVVAAQTRACWRHAKGFCSASRVSQHARDTENTPHLVHPAGEIAKQRLHVLGRLRDYL